MDQALLENLILAAALTGALAFVGWRIVLTLRIAQGASSQSGCGSCECAKDAESPEKGFAV